ncbi:MAG: hypothetical protein KKI18_06960 [Planctomycetes bacterium]|nr:hypothetical protein [Planctomycetota bacterium]MBU1518627.1 hypothetical protein [Planctomycetota bacterium]
MATITFHCPKCEYLCAFKDAYAGRRARCLRCNQVFIIPTSDNAKAEKVKLSKEIELGKPLPGFYEAVFKYSWRAIFKKQSLGTLLFILIATALKFFVVHLDYSVTIPCRSGGTIAILLPVGLVITGFAWGGIFWCYAEIVYSTAFDVESLPQITFGGGFGYILLVLKSFCSFTVALLIVMLPAIIIKKIFGITGIQQGWTVFSFVVLGLFLFPMAVMMVSISRDLLMLFRLDYFFTPIRKAFWHYLFLAGLFVLTWQMQYISLNYEDVAGRPNSVIALHLSAVLGIQILAIFTMRATGLFYRHFACYFKW